MSEGYGPRWDAKQDRIDAQNCTSDQLILEIKVGLAVWPVYDASWTDEDQRLLDNPEFPQEDWFR